MIINGKKYIVDGFSFNDICNLEGMGINLENMDEKMFSTIRGVLAIIMKTDLETAGSELEEHVIAGGNLEELSKDIAKVMENSGFFQAMNNPPKEE